MPTPSPPMHNRALRLRMAVAALLLAVVYLVFIAVLVAAGIGSVAVAVIAALTCVVHYLACDRLALAAAGAEPVRADETPVLHAVLERLCARATLPMPALAVSPASRANAFTVGRTPSTATICVTRGLLEELDERGLEAVLAHELAHVAGRDVMVMTLAGVFASLAAVLVRIGGRLRGGGEHRPPPVPIVIAADVVYLLSYMLVQALSRERELAADRAAAALTGDPESLADALRTLHGTGRESGAGGLPGELAPFQIVAPDVTRTVATMFETHPPVAVRVRALSRPDAAVAA